MCFYIWFWVWSLVPDNGFQCSVAGDCDGCKRRILGLSWQQCGLPEPVESKEQRPDSKNQLQNLDSGSITGCLYVSVSYKNLNLVQAIQTFQVVWLLQKLQKPLGLKSCSVNFTCIPGTDRWRETAVSSSCQHIRCVERNQFGSGDHWNYSPAT